MCSTWPLCAEIYHRAPVNDCGLVKKGCPHIKSLASNPVYDVYSPPNCALTGTA